MTERRGVYTTSRNLERLSLDSAYHTSPHFNPIPCLKNTNGSKATGVRGDYADWDHLWWNGSQCDFVHLVDENTNFFTQMKSENAQWGKKEENSDGYFLCVPHRLLLALCLNRWTRVGSINKFPFPWALAGLSSGEAHQEVREEESAGVFISQASSIQVASSGLCPASKDFCSL